MNFTGQPETESVAPETARPSILVKCALVGVLTLILLIPSVLIQDLISERQGRQQEVIDEISDKWSASQRLGGPVLILPYKTTLIEKDSTGRARYREGITNIYLLPENLEINGNILPEVLHRAMFDAVVYTTKINVRGNFGALELRKSGIRPEQILWNKARLAVGLSDLKGLKNNPVIKVNDSLYNAEADFSSLRLFANNLIILPDLSIRRSTSLSFSFNLDVRGSSELQFMHLAKSTKVKLSGTWSDPSFSGRYLPEDRRVSDGKFNAFWKMSYFNRPIPQQWMEQNATLRRPDSDLVFGVKLVLPVDQYQKTMRSAKYAILIILLTFMSLLFTEILIKKPVHLFQYVLIGAAMTIYYTLLLSFSEQVGFTAAYLIASIATVTLVGVFIGALLKDKKPALIFSAILVIFYTFIFVIIQLEDLALLVGSVGLFIVVAIAMYLSAKINWARPALGS